VEEGKGAQVLVRTPGLRDITGQWPIRDGLCGPEWVLASHRGLGHQGVGKCSLMLAVGRCREPGGEIGPFGGLLLVLFEPPVARKCWQHDSWNPSTLLYASVIYTIHRPLELYLQPILPRCDHFDWRQSHCVDTTEFSESSGL